MLGIDGGFGEGGGQLLRLAVALSAITGIAVRIDNIRARRDKPGLAPQHLAAVSAVGKLCAAKIGGLALRSQSITFEPQQKPHGGDYRFDIGTAGSITLVLQALLPVLLSASNTCHVQITGGTDVRQAPPVDYLREVLLRLIKRLGAIVSIQTLRRGYYPQGGGLIEVTTSPAKLKPVMFATSKNIKTVHGIAHVSNLPEHIAQRMKHAALEQLAAGGMQAMIDTPIFGRETAVSPGGTIVCWAENEQTALGAASVAERGIPAETLGHAVGEELAADLAAGVALDRHATDQILVYLALAGGGSLTTRCLTSHAYTAMWLIEQFLPVCFEYSETSGIFLVTVKSLKNSA